MSRLHRKKDKIKKKVQVNGGNGVRNDDIGTNLEVYQIELVVLRRVREGCA